MSVLQISLCTKSCHPVRSSWVHNLRNDQFYCMTKNSFITIRHKTNRLKKNTTTKVTKETQKQFYFTRKNTKDENSKSIKNNIKNRMLLCVPIIDFSQI